MATPTTGPAKSRPRNSQATKELLLAAAIEEFSEYGLAGARIDRIADRAEANKRLLYMYFGDKDRLFDTVLARQIEAVLKAVPLENGDLLAFAAARFDYMLANPQVNRLATWRTLERAEPTEAERESFQERVASVAAGHRQLAQRPAGAQGGGGRRPHVVPAAARTSSGAARRGPQRYRTSGLEVAGRDRVRLPACLRLTRWPGRCRIRRR
jgi:AcrR family transcriptional regulator